MKAYLIIFIPIALSFILYYITHILVSRIRREAAKKRLASHAEYMDRTLPCPHCKGVGRICREGYAFDESNMNAEYEKEMSEADIPYLVKKAMEDKKK